MVVSIDHSKAAAIDARAPRPVCKCRIVCQHIPTGETRFAMQQPCPRMPTHIQAFGRRAKRLWRLCRRSAPKRPVLLRPRRQPRRKILQRCHDSLRRLNAIRGADCITRQRFGPLHHIDRPLDHWLFLSLHTGRIMRDGSCDCPHQSLRCHVHLRSACHDLGLVGPGHSLPDRLWSRSLTTDSPGQGVCVRQKPQPAAPITGARSDLEHRAFNRTHIRPL
jgi:hypothetical protein